MLNALENKLYLFCNLISNTRYNIERICKCKPEEEKELYQVNSFVTDVLKLLDESVNELCLFCSWDRYYSLIFYFEAILFGKSRIFPTYKTLVKSMYDNHDRKNLKRIDRPCIAMRVRVRVLVSNRACDRVKVLRDMYILRKPPAKV